MEKRSVRIVPMTADHLDQVAELESTVARQQEEIRQKDDTIAQLESEGSQALKEELEAAYEEGVERNG